MDPILVLNFEAIVTYYRTKGKLYLSFPDVNWMMLMKYLLNYRFSYIVLLDYQE